MVIKFLNLLLSNLSQQPTQMHLDILEHRRFHPDTIHSTDMKLKDFFHKPDLAVESMPFPDSHRCISS
jgi:hypothetical protein